MSGYFSILRDDLDTLRYLSSDDVKLYVYLASRAAYRDTPVCPKGSLFDSLDGLADRSGLPRGKVRYGLMRLRSSGLIGLISHRNRHTICVTSYSKPDLVNTESNTQLTHEQHTINTQLTRLEEVKTLRSKEMNKTNQRKPSALSAPKIFIKPKIEEVRAYASSIGFNLDASQFWDHYEANGWRVGRTPMKDWQAAVRTWRRSEYPNEDKRAPSVKLTPVKEKWREVPKSEDLVPMEDIQKLLSNLKHGKTIPAMNGGTNAT